MRHIVSIFLAASIGCGAARAAAPEPARAQLLVGAVVVNPCLFRTPGQTAGAGHNSRQIIEIKCAQDQKPAVQVIAAPPLDSPISARATDAEIAHQIAPSIVEIIF